MIFHIRRLDWLLAGLLVAAAPAQEPPPPLAAEIPAEVVPPAAEVSAESPPPAAETRAEVVPAVVTPAVAVDRTISRSGQFRVSGADGLVRGGVAATADDAKDELLALTGEKDDWKIPIGIALHGKQGDPLPPRSVAMRLVLNDTGCELTIDVHLSRGIELQAFKHKIAAALLYERALRLRIPDEKEPLWSMPPWLVEGLREATAWRQGRSDRRLYETLFRHGGLYRPQDLFAVDEADFEVLDGASRAAFIGTSGALVMALAEQPQGKEGLAAFLTEVAPYQGEMPLLLRRHFPELNLSQTSLAKWLSLKLADLATPTTTDVPSVAATDAALTEALTLHYHDAANRPQRCALEDWEQLPELKELERAAAVRRAREAVVRLSYRCFPSYRPLLAEYDIALRNLASNRTRGLAAQLAALRVKRDEMLALCERARDYLDWFEITLARDTSGLFDDYMRLKARLENRPQRRDDPLTIYLDRIDKLLAREQPRERPVFPDRFPGLPTAFPNQFPGLPALGADVLPDLPSNLPQHLPIDQRPVQPPPADVPIDLPQP